MAEKFISERNLKFLMYEVYKVEDLLKYPRYADHSREVFDMLLDTAMKMGKTLFNPIFSEMDKKAPEYVNGEVKVHPAVRTIMRECGTGGWYSAVSDYEAGGQQLPFIIGSALPTAIFTAANYSVSVYGGLTTKAGHLIEHNCTKEIQDLYLPKMYGGEWQGTMALTEAQAGSSLADIACTALPTDQGYYLLKGQKLFISCGDHDGVDNVIHLLLAKIKGAPAGVKGISMFIVPKKRIEPDGRLVPNDVNCAGIYHKLGYRGSPITQLSFGESEDCRAWLVGEPNRGLFYMFEMMNGSRISVGAGATGIASAAYYASLEYATERLQGRKLSSKDPLGPQVPIFEHPDVKRMLLFQKAVVEGSLSLLMQCGYLRDMEFVLEREEKEKASLLLDILIPVAKTYPSEMGILSVSAGLQCLGGYGYCDEFPLEQHFRDSRIHPIHEGTTGIQGIDLLGRKISMKKGKALQVYLAEVKKAIDAGKAFPETAGFAGELEKAVVTLKRVTKHLLDVSAKGDPEMFLADATLYLEFFGYITIAWQWLRQGTIAQNALNAKPSGDDINFYMGKIFTIRYFFGYELPKIEGLAKRLENGDDTTIQVKREYME